MADVLTELRQAIAETHHVEAGYDNPATVAFRRLEQQSSPDAVNALRILLDEGDTSDAMCSILENADYANDDMLTLLTGCLFHDSSSVRDSACLGIDSMCDRRAIPHLRAAVRNEKSNSLRADMQQVLNGLEELPPLAMQAVRIEVLRERGPVRKMTKYIRPSDIFAHSPIGDGKYIIHHQDRDWLVGAETLDTLGLERT